jgi:hypothetical protein
VAHDVYSLGVCIIEIFTWKGLLIATEPPVICQDFVQAFALLGLKKNAVEPYIKFPDQIKETLCCMCDDLLLAVAGNKMARLVKDFLTCLNSEEEHNEN